MIPIYYVYILRCSDGYFYTGSTCDLQKRLMEHNTQSKPCRHTSTRLPVALAWNQAFSSQKEARDTEYKIKRWSRAKKEALIAGDWSTVSNAAKKNFN